MKVAVAVLLGLSLAACRYDAAYVQVTVVGTQPSVQQLTCTITSSVAGSSTISVPGTPGAALDLPQSFTLRLPTAQRAQITVDVVAGAELGSATVAVDGVGVYPATITLGGELGDQGTNELSPADAGTSSYDAGATDGSTGTLTGYPYARDFTIHRSAVGVTGGPSILNDYPVPIQLTDPTLRSAGNLGHVAQGNGDDITFITTGSSCNGTATCTLASDLVRYDAANGVVSAWVRVPQLATSTSTDPDTVVTMLYGNFSIKAPVVAPTTTWDTSFHGVWHLAKDNTDATVNGHDATSTSFTGLATGALFGGAEAFNGTSSYVQLAQSDALEWSGTGGFTVSIWEKTSASGQQTCIFSNRQYVPYELTGWDIYLDTKSTPHDWTGGVSSPPTYGDTPNGGDLTDNKWHLVAFVVEGTSITGYQDGKSIGSATSTATSATSGLGVLIGADYSTSVTDMPEQFFNGALEEARVSATARSAAWMATDYSLLTSSAAIAIGPERTP